VSDAHIAGNIIQILAGLPAFLRKTMLKNRMNEFFTLSEEEKREMVTNALNAAPTLDFNVLANLTKTWMEILCEFDDGKRANIFNAYASVIMGSPLLLSRLNIDGLIAVFNSLPENGRSILASSLRTVVQGLPDERKENFLNAIPENAKKVLSL
jgi:hypothetical protein